MPKRKVENTIYVDMLMERISLIQGFTKLKKAGCVSGAKAIISKLAKSTTKLGNEYRMTLFPQTYGQLRMSRLTYHTESTLEKELEWGKNIFISCAEQIDAFQSERKEFENYMLLGSYKNAKESIERIKKAFGCSLWSMEQEFLLYELQNGLEANKEFLNELNLVLTNSWTLAFADFFSMKAERNLNISQYLFRIDRRFNRLSDEAKVYFKMHFVLEVNVDNIEWDKVLRYASASSVIDYYLDFCKICTYLISHKSSTEKIKSHIRSLARELREKIDDPIMDKISFSGQGFRLSDTECFIQEMGKNYTEGRYQTVMEMCSSVLARKANIFEVYEYYIKSCIISGNIEGFSKRNHENSYLNEKNDKCLSAVLLDVLFAVYQKKEDCEIAFDEIWVLMRYLNGFFIVLFGKLNKPTFFKLNALVFETIYTDIRNPCTQFCILF